jgi:hypothetical protein
MFKFPLHAIDDTSLNALSAAMSLAAGATGNTIFTYLALLLGNELIKRIRGEAKEEDLDVEIALPIGDCTPNEVIAVQILLTHAIKESNCHAAPAVKFLDGCRLQIDLACSRLAAMGEN